jgi:hypothetical protein
MATEGVRRGAVRKVGRTRSRIALEEGFEPIGGKLAVLRRRRINVAVDELDVDVELEVVYDKQVGRLVIESFHARKRPNGPPITSDLLRRIPVAGIVAANTKVTVLYERESGRWQPVGTERLDDEDEEHYVARIYRMASVGGYPPTKAVQEALGVAESTAAQKVMLARKLKLLPKTRPGKARA